MKVGESIKFKRKFTSKEVKIFSQLSGDKNPLHLSRIFASKTSFKRPILHGMLLGSLCSRVVGMYLPGRKCLYLGQDLVFKSPVFVGETVEVQGRVVSFSESTQTGEVEIVITKQGKLCVSGMARVMVI